MDIPFIMYYIKIKSEESVELFSKTWAPDIKHTTWSRNNVGEKTVEQRQQLSLNQ